MYPARRNARPAGQPAREISPEPSRALYRDRHRDRFAPADADAPRRRVGGGGSTVRTSGGRLAGSLHRDQSSELPAAAARRRGMEAARSEEHTSELQSLMRISYAVFCVKKQNQNVRDHVIMIEIANV